MTKLNQSNSRTATEMELAGEDVSQYGCRDCGCPPSAMPLDTTLPGEQWNLICPDGGMLCASCINKRASKLPHVINLHCHITFKDDYKRKCVCGHWGGMQKTKTIECSEQ